MAHPSFDALLAHARTAHETRPALRGFCNFPEDLLPSPITPHHIPAADLMAQDRGLFATDLAGFRDAFVAASPVAMWRETYKGTAIAQNFLNRFACYCLIGQGGPWISTHMSSYVVYMPAGLDYPWHHHPAEEMYLVLAGQAEFMREGEAAETLGPGGNSFHASNQPHAMRTVDHPVMAYVVWRNNLDIQPVWTDREVNP